MTTTNPFEHVYTDPNGSEILVAAMPTDVLIRSLEHYLINKPEHDLNFAKGQILADYADDPNMDLRTAQTLGLRLPTEKERQAAEDALADTKRRIHIEAIRTALPFMLIALIREDTQEKAREICQEFTGITGQVNYQKWQSDVLQLLPGPALEVVDDFKANSNSAE